MKHVRLIYLFALVLTLFVSCSNNVVELIPVALEGKWGYINSRGEYAITPRFYSAKYFHEGLACVTTIEGNVGYIDEKANFVVKPEYKDGSNFSEGLAVVVKHGGHPTCINDRGIVVFTLSYARKLFSFHEDLAVFQDSSKKYGYVNPHGQVVIAPIYEDALSFSEDLAPVKIGGKWGYIDKTGKIVISVQFTSAKMFSEGLAAVSDGYSWGYISSNGLFEIAPQFEDAESFLDKTAVVTLSGKKGVINKDGKFEINPIYDALSDFYNGYALMQLRENYGYVDAKGAMAINAQFAQATDFLGDIAVVKTFSQYGNNSFALVDESGSLIAFPKLDRVRNYVDKKDYVEDNFYDATEIVQKFTKRMSSNSVDGFSGKSTLQSVVNSVIYGDYVNAIDTVSAVALNIQKITHDAVITKTEFYFANSMYSPDTLDKTTLVYDFTEPLTMYGYTIELRNEACNKGSVVARALSEAMANKISAQSVFGGNMCYVLQRNKRMSYVIFYTDEKIQLFVSHTKDTIESLINKHQDEE